MRRFQLLRARRALNSVLNDTNQCPFDYQQICFVKYISVMGHIEVTELELMRSGGGGV